MFAGIEAGGTTWVLGAVKTEDLDKGLNGGGAAKVTVHSRTVVPTTTPKETLSAVTDWLVKNAPKEEGWAGIGVASFGPVCLDKEDAQYGFITTTPKPGWANTDVLGAIKKALGDSCPPLGWDTDVNGAALAESQLGGHGSEGNQPKSVAYVTVGTGVGVGLVLDGAPRHGLLHPEGGHIAVAREVGDEGFKGGCPFHGACLEGCVASPGIAARVGVDQTKLQDIPDDHVVWKYVSGYLAQLARAVTLLLSVDLIVIGGGITQRASVVPGIRTAFLSSMAGYINHPKLLSEEQLATYIVTPGCGANAGLLGAFLLARSAVPSAPQPPAPTKPSSS